MFNENDLIAPHWPTLCSKSLYDMNVDEMLDYYAYLVYKNGWSSMEATAARKNISNNINQMFELEGDKGYNEGYESACKENEWD